jgi:TonB family protein
MRPINLSIVKGLLLISILSVDSAAIEVGIARLQTGNQDAAELAQASELNNAAVKLYNAERYDEALNAAKKALEIRERILAADDKRVIASIVNLAAIHLELKNYKEAEVYYKRLLAADEKQSGSDSLQVAKTLEVLAWLHHARGNESQAESAYKRVLVIKEKVNGPDSKEVAQTLFRIAEIYQSRGELEKAMPLYQRLLKFDDEVVLGASMTVSDVRHNLACLLRKMKKPDEAAKVVSPPDKGIDGQVASSRTAPPMQGGVLNGLALRLPKPEYPAEARFAGVSGTVVVQVTISEEGRVVRACAVHGHQLFWNVTERAAYAAQFAPTKLSGKPVRVTGVITYNFIRN